MAPLFVNGKVIIGASGGEFLKRGHVSVYDAEAGRRLWRFYTVPGPGEFGHDTWESDWTDEIDALARAIDPVAVSRVCALNSSAPIDMSHGTRARSSSPARRSGTTGAPLRIRLAPTSPAAIPSRNGMHVKWQGLVWSLSA
jgi:hypothetical protein